MKSKSGLSWPAAVLVALATAFAFATGATAAQPTNASFETGNTSGWTQTLNGGSIIAVANASPPPNTGAWSAQLTAGQQDAPVTLSQSFFLGLGESVSGWAAFVDEENNSCSFNDNALVRITDPLATDTTLFIASSCNTGSVPFLFWTFTATAIGIHTLEGWVANAGDSSVNSKLLMDANYSGPSWTVYAKEGGGNLINPSFPDYEFGEWSRKNVMIYLKCIPDGSPIDTEYKDQAVPFRDGIHYYATRPNDRCIDENGGQPVPLTDVGPIMVDTKAPLCKVSPTTIYLPRGTVGGSASFNIDFTDATSGYDGMNWILTTAGGAVWGTAEPNGDPVGTFDITGIDLPNSTAARIDVTLFAFDVAGNVSTCKIAVRAR